MCYYDKLAKIAINMIARLSKWLNSPVRIAKIAIPIIVVTLATALITGLTAGDFSQSFLTELAGIAVTVFIIDRIYDWRDTQKEQERVNQLLRLFKGEFDRYYSLVNNLLNLIHLYGSDTPLNNRPDNIFTNEEIEKLYYKLTNPRNWRKYKLHSDYLLPVLSNINELGNAIITRYIAIVPGTEIVDVVQLISTITNRKINNFKDIENIIITFKYFDDNVEEGPRIHPPMSEQFVNELIQLHTFWVRHR